MTFVMLRPIDRNNYTKKSNLWYCFLHNMLLYNVLYLQLIYFLIFHYFSNISLISLTHSQFVPSNCLLNYPKLLLPTIVSFVSIFFTRWHNIAIEDHYKIILLSPKLNITASFITKILNTFQTCCKCLHILWVVQHTSDCLLLYKE